MSKAPTSEAARIPRPRPDYPSRDLADLAYQFDYFGEQECTQLDAHLYRALCRGIREDRELLAIAAHAPANQPPPNLLFAAVHDLLLAGAEHALREWYPALAEGPARPVETVFEPFRDFCLAHRADILPLVAGRMVQTNVVQRTSGLLPAFARAFAGGGGAPLSLIEIGCSAGLNLQWSRFRYAYSNGVQWGDPGARVVVECEARGDVPLPVLPPELPVAWRRGVDLHPIDLADPDAVRWLRALVWPDHPGRQERITAAIEVAREDPPEILAADASLALPGLIEQAPAGTTVCVYGTHTLYQFPRDALMATFRAMQAASRTRPVRFISIEGTGDHCSELHYTLYRDGERETTVAARCNPHGRWLEWLGGGAV
jgi:hypothetical protein